VGFSNWRFHDLLMLQGILVGARGFEPRTPCAQGRCATRLRYAPTPTWFPSIIADRFAAVG
jgi:hypothetical protein